MSLQTEESDMRDDIDFNIAFCQIIEQYPALYDYNRSDYCNRNVQSRIWRIIANKLQESENDCRERWKNIRGRYGKYKKAKAKPTDKLAKRVKEYYLAPYLSFLDNFLKARPYKRLFRKSLKTETHDGDGHDDNEDMHADETLQWPWPHQSTQSHQQPDSCFVVPVDPALSSEYMGSELAAALQDATEAEKPQMIKKKTVKLDTDLSFLKSVLPDMKAMTQDQKRRFKIGILNMAGEILKENPRCTTSGQCRGGLSKAPTPPSQ